MAEEMGLVKASGEMADRGRRMAMICAYGVMALCAVAESHEEETSGLQR